MRRSTTLTAAVCCLAMALVPTVASAKGKPGAQAPTPASISLNQSDPHAGDLVTFTVSYPAMREDARVALKCWQGGEMVYQYASDPGAYFHLWSVLWTSGAADCTADLFYYTYQGQTQTGRVDLASTSFTVAA